MDMETSPPAFSSTTTEGPAATPTSSGRIVVRIRVSQAWTPEEDACRERLAGENGFRRWRRVASAMSRRRTPGQCRDRWRDHLARDVYHRPFTSEDDAELARIRLRDGRGRWKDISRAVYCRSSRALKRRWRELRKSDAFLRALYWYPHQPVQPPADSIVLSCSVGCDAVAGGGKTPGISPAWSYNLQESY
uniref:Myb-like domain-containing protein n=1 Tax=Oryza brachyantha TaxID=4533 RepID=J3KXJ3_ORYBR